MPVLATFYGIVIRMLFVRLLGARFHAIYGDSEIVVNICPLRIVQGDAPPDVQDRVMAWAAQHQTDLLAAWDRCQAGLSPKVIGNQ